MTQREIRRPEGLKVTYRRMRFPFEDGFDRDWHSGSAFKSLMWDQLSAAFEPGEKFFIDAARALKSEIEDPALLEEITEFCRQEGHHTAQHIKFDRMNAEMGVDIELCQKRFNAVLDRARNKLTPLGMLAATCALEHFTASLAEHYLVHPELSEGADPGVHALWRWHAVEETEHKATTFDMYRQLAGPEGKRRVLMVGAWFLLTVLSVWNTLSLVRQNGTLFSRDTWRGLVYMFGRRGVFSGLIPAFFAYQRLRFHPWREDSSHLVRAWQESDQQQYVLNKA